MMPLQRVRVAESRMRNKLANGPLRVQSNGCFPEYSATCGHTSVAGDMLVSRQAHGVTAVNQGGTADSVVLFIYVHDSSLTDLFFSVRGVFFIPINSSDKIATKSSVMISGSEV